jgi:FkbM family methyltransferase
MQIGANIGCDAFFKEMCLLNEASKIWLIEPNTSLLPILNKCYNSLSSKHSISILPVGVSTKPEQKTLYIDKIDFGGCSSILKRKTLPRIADNPVTIQCLPFNDLCFEFGITSLEKLCIDTEGYDYTIVNSIDFSKIDIKCLECEVWIHDDDDLNGNIQTGPKYFKEIILPKMSEKYQHSLKTESDGQMTHIFIKK